MREVLVRGQPLWVQDNEALSNHIVREGDYFEAPILDYIYEHYPIHGNIIDIGANIGNHTVFFSRYLQYNHIYSFEPVPRSYEVLELNIRNLPNITIAPVAISSKLEELEFSLNRENWGVTEVVTKGDVKVIAIPLDYFHLRNVTLIKIDVEYWEPNVILGAKETLANNKPLILIEDANNTYAELLPNFTKIKYWEQEKTYLYAPKGD